MIKRIGILTSGGDAPGMNCAIRAVTKAGSASGLEVYGIYDGYKGLIEDEIELLTDSKVDGIEEKGGTILRTARLPEFKEKTTRLKAVATLKKHGIEALVVIGGDGSYMGAMRLTEMGINCVGLPGTIDNDIASSEYTIGYDTALNTIVRCVSRIKDTGASHTRCSVVECMGNHCGDLTLFGSIALGADVLITPDYPTDDETVINKLKNLKKKDPHRSSLVMVAEKFHPDLNGLVKRIASETNFDTRLTVLGHIQRGGSPSAFDRILATRMGVYAVKCLCQNQGGICIGIMNNKLVSYPIYDALKLPRDIHQETLDILASLQ